MAGSSRQGDFDREFRRQIERFSAALVADLRRITTTEVPPVVKILSFEMQADWRDFPVHAFAMDDQAPNEKYFEPPFHGQLLPDAGPLIAKGVIDQDNYEEAGVDTFVSGARLMAEWFGECWHAAGGGAFPIPAYINLHDHTRYFDLRRRQWVRMNDVWP